MKTDLHCFKFDDVVITTFLYMHFVQAFIFSLVFSTDFFSASFNEFGPLKTAFKKYYFE